MGGAALLALAEIDPDEELRRIESMDDPQSLDSDYLPVSQHMAARLSELVELREFLRAQKPPCEGRKMRGQTAG